MHRRFRAHLAEHPGKGWALQGLRQALAAQGKQAEAISSGLGLQLRRRKNEVSTDCTSLPAIRYTMYRLTFALAPFSCPSCSL
jgi:hypothetical protein